MLAAKKEQMNAGKFPFEDTYWDTRGNSKLLTYTGPALEKNLELQAVQQFVRKKGALGAIWNYDHDYADNGPWYRCICDAVGYDENCISSKNARHNLRRSLKRCTVRQIDYQWLAENGYDVYIKAASRYSNFKLESRERFCWRMLDHCKVEGAEAFGVFVGEKLVAYITLFICGEKVRGDTAGFDPAYSSAYPMYALYYKVAQHYLNEKGYKEFDRGTRPLMHETNVDEFLLRLGYRKSYCRLGVYFVWPVQTVLSIARIFRKMYRLVLPSRHRAILDGLLLAQDMAKATSVKIHYV